MINQCNIDYLLIDRNHKHNSWRLHNNDSKELHRYQSRSSIYIQSISYFIDRTTGRIGDSINTSCVDEWLSFNHNCTTNQITNTQIVQLLNYISIITYISNALSSRVSSARAAITSSAISFNTNTTWLVTVAIYHLDMDNLIKQLLIDIRMAIINKSIYEWE